MKKKLYILLLAMAGGAGVGYYRAVLMGQYYDPLTKTIAAESGTSMLVMTALSLAVLGLLAFFACRMGKGLVFDKGLVSKRLLPYAICSAVLSLVVAYAAISLPGAGTYDIIFAAAVLFGGAASLMAVKATGELQRLMSLCPVLPMILSVLHIYKDNIKYPNISNFIMEVLATIFLMLASYYAFSIFFKKVKPAYFSCTFAFGVFFSFVCIVYNLMMTGSAVTPAIPPYFSIYFISAIIYLSSFFTLLVPNGKLPFDTLTYYGWSAFTVESGGRVLGIDNYCRKLAQVQYSTMENFPKSDCIVLSHNHPDHCLDIAAFAERDGCPVIAPQQFLSSDVQLAKGAMTAGDFVDFELEGFDITTFAWKHRDMETVPTAQDEQAFAYDQEPECFGHIVKLPSGNVLVNLSEGANPHMTKETLKKIANVAGQVDYLLLGYQLDFVKECVLCCDMLMPKSVILFHPHEALFEAQNIATKPVKDYIKALEKALPSGEVVALSPMDTKKLYIL